MKIYKYISLNLLSFLAYILFALSFYVFFVQPSTNKIFITLNHFAELYTLISYISLFFILLFILEKWLVKKYNKTFIKVNITNHLYLKNFLLFPFYFGLFCMLFNIFVFLSILFFLILA